MKKLTIVLIVLLIVFWGCDFYGFHSLSVDNRTNDTIKVVFIDKSPYKMIVEPDSLYFPPLQKKMFYGVLAGATRYGCDYTGIKKDEIEIYTLSGKKLKKDIWNVNNWDCKGSFRSGWEKTFIIIEDDLGSVPSETE